MIDYRDEGKDLFFVIRGHCRVVVPIAGKETILRDIKHGAFFGKRAALDPQPRSAAIIAVTDTTLARMPARRTRPWCRRRRRTPSRQHGSTATGKP